MVSERFNSQRNFFFIYGEVLGQILFFFINGTQTGVWGLAPIGSEQTVVPSQLGGAGGFPPKERARDRRESARRYAQELSTPLTKLDPFLTLRGPFGHFRPHWRFVAFFNP